MKFNTTYVNNLTKFETIKSIHELKKDIVSYFSTKRNLTYIDVPAYYEEGSDFSTEPSMLTRKVTFDLGDEYKTCALSQSPSNWLRNFIVENEMEKDFCLWTQTTSIWRDNVETPTTSIQKTELTFMYEVDSIDPMMLNKLSQDIYEMIYKISSKASRKYELYNVYPYFAEYVSAQQLENEMPKQEYKFRETEVLKEKGALILRNTGDKLYSGNFHEIISPSLYDLKLYNQILLKDFINIDVLNVATVAVIATGQTLKDQLQRSGVQSTFTKKLIQNQINYVDKKIVEIKFNIPKLAMAILNKGHIGETLPGVTSNEAKNINKKYYVKIL